MRRRSSESLAGREREKFCSDEAAKPAAATREKQIARDRERQRQKEKGREMEREKELSPGNHSHRSSSCDRWGAASRWNQTTSANPQPNGSIGRPVCWALFTLWFISMWPVEVPQQHINQIVIVISSYIQPRGRIGDDHFRRYLVPTLGGFRLFGIEAFL